MKSEADVAAFIAARPSMTRLLDAVAALRLPDCWIGAGFLRNAVWDSLHGLTSPLTTGDVDVVYFDAEDDNPERDAAIEGALAEPWPDIPWSVKNQARMHRRNGDPPYDNSGDALRHWPERCTAVAARRGDTGIELLAPFGVGDLLALIVRPTPAFATKPEVYQERLRQKNWRERWPRLQIFDEPS